MKPEHIRRGAGLLAIAFPLAVYAITLAREITFVDSGELAAVAARLGIAHPPGYPLFTLVGHVFSLLPFGTACWRVGLLSALCAALTCGLIFFAGSVIGERLLEPRVVGRGRALIVALPALAGALLFAFSQTFWSQAVVVEIYALQVLLLMLFLFVYVRSQADPGRALAYWPWIAFTAGLALTNHLTGLLLGAAVIIFWIVGYRDRARAEVRCAIPFWRGVVAGLLPLLLYAYLPLRSLGNPAVRWAYPDNWHRFLMHVTARQYQDAFGKQGLSLAELQRFLAQQLPGEAGWLFVALAALGLGVLVARAWRIALATFVTAGLYLLYNLAYPIHDIALYYAPVLAIFGLWAAVGAGKAVRLAARWRSAAGPALGGLLCLGCLLPLTQNWRANDQHDFKLLRHYVYDAMKTLDPNAILFSGDWDRFSAPALYYQKVEGLRPDVLVIDMNSIAHPALGRRLAADAPELAAAARAPIDSLAVIANLAELRKPYDVEAARRLYARLQRVLLDEAMKMRPAYITSDIFRHPMLQGYRLITEGLVVRVSHEDTYRPFPLPDFEGPGITRAQARNLSEEQLQFEYGRMLRNRARFCERHGYPEEAQAAARRAEELSR
jgi:hypothetical protein